MSILVKIYALHVRRELIRTAGNRNCPDDQSGRNSIPRYHYYNRERLRTDDTLLPFAISQTESRPPRARFSIYRKNRRRRSASVNLRQSRSNRTRRKLPPAPPASG